MKQFLFSPVALAIGSSLLLSACGTQNNTSNSTQNNAQDNTQDNIQRKMEQSSGLQQLPLKTADFETVISESVGVARAALTNSVDYVVDDYAVIDEVVRPIAKPKKISRGKWSSAKAVMVAPFVYGTSSYMDSVDGENYHGVIENPVNLTIENSVSTFSIDVDTASYSNMRRFINSGRMPIENAVRVEELINYFNYDYPLPESTEIPFLITTEIAPSPWNKNAQLLHIGIKGYATNHENLPNANLVFLVDVSGSMSSPQKMGLLKQSLKLITKKMRAQDRISIVVYAGASGVVLEGKSGNDKAEILRAIDQFQAGGSTNGAAGIQLAYQLAKIHFIEGGINRVLLATDGDFNVGTVNFDALIDLVEARRESGVSLTTLGFGQGNYNDHLMEQLADTGNGNYAYIDTLQEAKKVLVDEMASTLHTIAKDVKIQVEFNPQWVQEYRLIGYENRALKREDFNNDKVDAGEVGAGHSVTALYEITLVGSAGNWVDPLRYSGARDRHLQPGSEQSDELAFVKLRYKHPDSSNSKLMTKAVVRSSIQPRFDGASDRFKFSAAVAGFGQILSGGDFTKEFTLKQVENIGMSSKGSDVWGYRSEFVNLVRLAEEMAVEL